MDVAPIDLQPFREGTERDRAEVAEAFDLAGRTSGFFAVTGHGVDPSLLERMLGVTEAFFDLPIEEKMRYVVDDRAANRGDAPADARDRFFATNVWPSDEMRSTWTEYWAAVDRVAMEIMSAAAMALGMPADYFARSSTGRPP